MTYRSIKVNAVSKSELKRECADLKARSGSVVTDLVALEASRVDGVFLTASKYGLEAICGASCETGAQ